MSGPVVFHAKDSSLLTPAQEQQVIEEFAIHMQTFTPQMNQIAQLYNESARHTQLARIHSEKAQLCGEAALISSKAAKVSSEAAIISSEKAKESEEKAKKCNEDTLRHEVKALQYAKSSEAKKTEGEKKLLAADKGRQDLLATQFYLIFNAKKPEQAELGNLFNQYLTDKSIIIEKNPQGTSYLKINSMLPVISYLTNNLHVTICNFKAFKAEVQDVTTLADYLKTSKIAVVTFSTLISPESKTELMKAKESRPSLDIKFA